MIYLRRNPDCHRNAAWKVVKLLGLGFQVADLLPELDLEDIVDLQG